MKIAIFSPSKSNISETFIQAQISRLQGDIILYHTGDIPSCLNDNTLANTLSVADRVTFAIQKRTGRTHLTPAENALYRSLQKEKPDVVLAQYGITAAKNLRVIKSLGIPLVIHFHGYDASMYSVVEKNKQAYIEMFQYASAIIGVSNRMVEMLQEIGAPAEKLHHLCYGPNPRFQDIQPNYAAPHFLALGRFVDKKAPHLTILAFKQVIEKYPKAQLRIIGTGPLLMTCRDLVKHFHLEDHVHLLGAHGIERVLEEMKDVCAFVQHSRRALDGDMEGTPVAILEAQLAGLPVISTIHAGIPDVVISGETGLLVEENDVDGMATSMLRVLEDAEMASNMGRKGRARVLEHFTMEHYITSLQKIVESAARP
jgi:colanic acid/amylovoran biosynthesis glycosyltransferase